MKRVALLFHAPVTRFCASLNDAVACHPLISHRLGLRLFNSFPLFLFKRVTPFTSNFLWLLPVTSLSTSMAFTSFVGRILFASVFIASAWQEFSDFGKDGGPAAQALEPKFHTFSNHVSTHTGIKLPKIEVKDLVSVSIFLKGVGGPLFIFGNCLGAYLLLLHQAIFTPLLCDFYNYDVETKEFTEHFLKFTQSLALFGALLFYIGMRNSMPRRQLRKKAPKDKTV